MIKHYFTFTQNQNQYYVIIIADSESTAKDVFKFLYQTKYIAIYKNNFTPNKNQQLYETVTQRLTEN